MTATVTTRLARTVSAAAFAVALAVPACAQESYTDPQAAKPPVQNVSYNGYSCDMVRAKVAESGITAAYAFALSMGMSRSDIAKVRKACSV